MRSVPPGLVETLERRRLLSTYTLTDLVAVGGLSFVTDINEAGQIVGVKDGRAVLWKDGATTDLGTPVGVSARPNDLNNFGQAVGFIGSVTSGPTTAVRWQDGVMYDLGLGNDSNATAINDAGDIVGTDGGRAFRWRDGVVTDLGELFPGGGASAADINDAGEIAGSSYSGLAGSLGLPVNHAFIWRDGAMTDLITAPFTDGSYPNAINNLGQVVGSTTVFVNTGYGAAFISKSFVYDGTKMIVLPVPSLQNFATDVNDAGQVVGTMSGRAYLYEDGVVKDLNTMLAPGTPAVGSVAAINNAGQIVGHSSTGRPVLLTPDGPAPEGPEVQVWVEAAEVADGSGTVTFGETTLGAPVTRTVSVRNVGGAALELPGSIQAPAGFSVVAGFGATSLAPRGVTTFVLRQDATAAGVFGGDVSFATNDTDEGTFNFAVSGAVSPARVIDDGGAGFSVSGTRVGVMNAGYQGDARRIAPANRLLGTTRTITSARFRATATWSFGNVEPGTYRVSATWTPGMDRATNVPFTVLVGGLPLASMAVNQRVAPDDLAAHGAKWEELGTFTAAGALSVRMSNQANGWVIADAVRIERVDTPATQANAGVPAAGRLPVERRRSVYEMIVNE